MYKKGGIQRKCREEYIRHGNGENMEMDSRRIVKKIGKDEISIA